MFKPKASTIVSLLALFALAGPACAAEEVIGTAHQADGQAVPYLLNTASAAPHYVLILFPGGVGVVDPHLEDGVPVYQARGNFLLRARSYLVDEEFATAATNASSDPARIQSVIDDLQRRFAGVKIYLMGTSRGTTDTLALAGYLSDKIAGEIHTSSMSAVAAFDPRGYANRHLLVHHRNDGCRVTPLASAQYSHEHFGTELIVMEGGTSIGKPCEALAYHGYNGIERETSAAIKAWVRAAP